MNRSAHVILYTHDVPRLRAFYGLLGFSPSPGEAEAAAGYVEMTLGAVTLGIQDVAAATGYVPPLDGHSAAVVLQCDDADDAHARLLRAGAPSLQAPADDGDSVRAAWVGDPDGNPVRLIQRPSTTSEAPAAHAGPPTAPPGTASAPAPTPPARQVSNDLDLPQSPLPAGYYTEDGTPTFDAVAERIHQRSATADGNQVLDAESERRQDETDQFSRLKEAGKDRLAQLRRSMGMDR